MTDKAITDKAALSSSVKLLEHEALEAAFAAHALESISEGIDYTAPGLKTARRAADKATDAAMHLQQAAQCMREAASLCRRIGCL